MAEFIVKMADERGQMLQQIESGASAAELRERFAQQGFLVYDIRPRGLFSKTDSPLSRKRRIKLDQFIIFNSQFVTLIRAGLPILMALDLLSKRQRNEYFRAVLENVRDRVRTGELLSQAFESQNVTSKIYTTSLLAGEKSGNLEEVLNRYIAFQRVSMTFRKKLMGALVYPTLLLAMMGILFTVLIVWVVPKFGELYGELHAELPAITLFLLGIGKSAQRYFLVVMGALAAAIYLIRRWKETKGGAEWIDKFKLSIPVFGPIWLKYQVAMFARTMSTLLGGGIPLVPALETAGGSMASSLIAGGIINAAQRVREGQPLALSLEQTGVFPELSVEMVEVGESTGALPAMLASVAEFYEEDVNTGLAVALSLIEPVMLIIMGVVVALVLISLYMPIFNLGAAATAGR